MDRGEFEAGPVQTQPSVVYKNKNNRGLVILLVIFVLATAGLGTALGITLMNKGDNKAENSKVANSTNSSEANVENTSSENNAEISNIPSRLYLESDGFLEGSRYYFASDEALQSDDLTKRSYINKNMYLIDLAKSGTKDMIKKYDLKSLIEPKLNEFIASLPDTISPDGKTKVKKSDCVFIVTYDTAMTAFPEEYFDEENVQLRVNYSVGWKYDGSSTYNAETGLGSYVAIINIPGHKLVNYAKMSD